MRMLTDAKGRACPTVSLLALAAAIASPAPALARDDAWYVGVEGGAMLVDDIDFDIGAPGDEDASASHRAGWDVDGVIGYDFGGFRAEAEVGYRAASVTAYESALPTPRLNDRGALVGDHPPGTYDYAGGIDSALAFMLNGLLDFGDDDGIQGFVGGGVGVARVKSELALNTGGDFLEDADTVLAWQVIAGLRAPLSDSIDVTFKYRFFNAENIKLTDIADRDYASRFRSHSLLGGLAFNFGSPASKQEPSFDDFSGRQREKEQAANRRHLDLHIGYGSTGVPRTNYGFVSDGPIPAPERPAAYSVPRIGGLAVGGGLDLGGLGSFHFDYAEGSARTRAEVPASTSGGRRGYPYTAISPSGSTGIGGNVPLDVDTEAAVESYRAAWRFQFGSEPPEEWLKPMIRPTAGIDVAYRDRDHLGITSITTPVIATQRLDQDVDELEIGIVAGLLADVPLGRGVRLELSAEAGAYYYDFDLRSVETNSQNFGPAADRAFAIAIDDSISGIGFRAGAATTFAIDLSDRMALLARGEADYSSARAQVSNPVSGTAVLSGAAASLAADPSPSFRFLLGARFRF